MTMTISRRIINEGAALYYSPGWYLLIESHLQWLLSRMDNRLLTVTDGDAYKFEADLSGLLLKSGIQTEYHWIIMRMNGYTSYTDYRVERTQLVVPDQQAIEQLVAVYRTTSKKIN